MLPDMWKHPHMMTDRRLNACPDQAIDTAISMLEGPEDSGTCALNGSTFTVECSPIPVDLSALPPSRVRQTLCSNTSMACHAMPCCACQARTGADQSSRCTELSAARLAMRPKT